MAERFSNWTSQRRKLSRFAGDRWTPSTLPNSVSTESNVTCFRCRSNAPMMHVNIQAQLGHESITTTIGTYGHPMQNSNRHVTHAFDRALRGLTGGDLLNRAEQ